MTSTANHDYWSLLGLKPGSNYDQLKRAFRREARRWHPDLNGNDVNAEERFKLVNEAYAVLTDPRRKEAWEKSYLNNNFNGDQFSEGFPDFEDYISVVLGLETNEDNEYLDESNIQDQVSWPTPAEQSTQPPVRIYEDIETILELTPEEALNGSTLELELKNGTLVEIRTPPFAGDGWRLRLAGVAQGGKDHFMQLRVMTDEGLRIDGLRVFYRLELFPHEAVLGCAVDVPTLSGPVTLQVPPESSSGRMLRLRGRGMEHDGERGDQLVEIIVVIPADLSDSERALYSRLQEISLDPEIS